MSINVNDILTGSGGRVWWNGKLIATLTKIEVKMSASYDDVEVCGDLTTYSLYAGWSGSGSISYLKVDSDIVDAMIEAYTSGVMPDIQIVTALTNSRTKKSARYQISSVAVTEILVASFESKKQVEEEVPFSFSTIRNLDGITS